MRSRIFVPAFALIAGIVLAGAGGCATSSDRPPSANSGGGDASDTTGSDPEYTAFRKRQAYRHCKEAGESNCDDLLKRD
jgi:hypothetical protein